MLKIIWIFSSILLGLNGEVLEEQACPVDCECYYSRINWVTDCSESNLTSIPYDELSLMVYTLDMNGNKVINLGTFPQDIKLRRLQIAHNKINQLNYEAFAGLYHLIDADFSSNNITKIDPEAFKDSRGLITLELQNNPLDEVQGQFLNCRGLLYLNLSSCGIRHMNEDFFSNTTTLITLDLSYNPLETLDPGPFQHLKNLEHLNLNNCNITHISPKTFSNLENLRTLFLANNNLKSISWTSILAQLIRLNHLDIENTGTTNLPRDTFANNHYLRHLVLANNQLHHLDVTNTLGHNLHNLYTLDLSNCALQDRLPEDVFNNASNLRILNLSGNPMFASDLTAVLRHIPQLRKLSLSNCSLRRLPDAFDALENLQELDISHNPLSDAFVKLLKPLTQLEYLDMSYCSLGHVGNNTLAQMTDLKKLILSGNNLHNLEQNLFRNLTRLESLDLSNCNLTTPLDPKVFGSDRIYSSIIELKLSGNPLTIPKEGPLLPKQLLSVETIDLSNCNITTLNENIFSNNKNLTQLNLSGNKLSRVEDLAFLKKLRRLQRLDLSNNNLTTIHKGVFEQNKHLTTLNLAGNPFVCNCSIAEMWSWAAREKNDLGLLVGSQTSDFTTSATKLKKSLACLYQPDVHSAVLDENNLDVKKLQRKHDRTPHRTWAKYVRETNCDKKL
ncbi:leucine-rich repeat-containing protein 15-like [Chelonus insularis]|uniref:leucine-rich repeat-containing protein 15-like n=1 Tax=Chelonus insularis TaxID=460826 RepID=UPI00158CE4C0|nr:leucine-rich repeat-containing protein 15-like [Chelonus insularis]